MAEKEEIVLITTRHKDEKLNMTFTVMYQEYTRQEAIERMAKGIHRYKNKGGLFVDGYAEAALNALLDGKNEKENN